MILFFQDYVLDWNNSFSESESNKAIVWFLAQHSCGLWLLPKANCMLNRPYVKLVIWDAYSTFSECLQEH